MDNPTKPAKPAYRPKNTPKQDKPYKNIAPEKKGHKGEAEEEKVEGTRKESTTSTPGNSDCCLICTDKIKIYAIGECGHFEFCWKCVLKNRTKMENNKCAYCNTEVKVLITTNKLSRLEDKNLQPIYDIDIDVYFETHKLKK
jgi:hypothetical protein